MMVLYDAEEAFNNYLNNKVQEVMKKAVEVAVRVVNFMLIEKRTAHRGNL